MTPLQQRVLSFVRDHIAEREYAPSFPEIGVGCNLKSKGQVHRVVHILIAAGYLRQEKGHARNLALTDKPAPQTKATVLDDFIARLERKCPAVTSWAMVRQVANEMRAEA
jgi:SOS-response transcriptional repressor LexA